MKMVLIATSVLHKVQTRFLTDYDGRIPTESRPHFQLQRVMTWAACTNLGHGSLVLASRTSCRLLGHRLAWLTGRLQAEQGGGLWRRRSSSLQVSAEAERSCRHREPETANLNLCQSLILHQMLELRWNTRGLRKRRGRRR